MTCTVCKQYPANHEFRMPFQPDNDSVCKFCWIEFQKFYEIWKGGTSIADYVGSMLKATRKEVGAAEKKAAQYKDMYEQCYKEQYGETPDDVDRYRYKKLYLEAMETNATHQNQLAKEVRQLILDFCAMARERDNLRELVKELKDSMQVGKLLDEKDSRINFLEKELKLTSQHEAEYRGEVDKLKVDLTMIEREKAELVLRLGAMTQDRDSLLELKEELMKNIEGSRKRLNELVDWINK